MPLYEALKADGTAFSIGGPDPRSDSEINAAERLFWQRPQPALGNALSLVQQAVEIALKGRIAEISPFLLIVRKGRELLKSVAGGDIPFSAFRTVDASDLLRLHTAVVEPAKRLDDKFARFWDDLRRRRNVLMHTARPSASEGADDLLTSFRLAEDIIRVATAQHPEKTWFERIIEHGEADETSAAHDIPPDLNQAYALRNFATVVEALPPAFVRSHMNIDLRRRRYMCPNCMGKVDMDYFDDIPFPRFGRVVEAPDESASVSCALCSADTTVMRGRCEEDDCRGSVLGVDTPPRRVRLQRAADTNDARWTLARREGTR